MRKPPRSSALREQGVLHMVLRVCLGPWPIRPGLIAVSLVFVNQYSIVRIAEASKESISEAWREGLAASVGQSALIYVVALLVSVAQRRIGPRAQGRSGYLLAVLVISLCYSLIVALAIERTADVTGLLIARNAIALLIVSAVFGIASYRVGLEGQRVSEALEIVREQREQLLLADEFARREVADYLHDNVQADLVVLSLQLRGLSTELPPAFSARLNSVLEELESLRMLDIRTASRRLSPDIPTLGLTAALRSLAETYSSTTVIDVDCPLSVNAHDDQLKLAVYRITEQALLNAAIHGKATRAEVRVVETPLGQVHLTITNDGQPLPSSHGDGSGTAIIEAWVSRYDGSWALTTQGGSTLLRAELSVAGH